MTPRKAMVLLVLLSSCVWADESADKTAMEATIAALNVVPVQASSFTTDATSDLERLPQIKDRSVRAIVPEEARPWVLISKQPQDFGRQRMVLKKVSNDWKIASLQIPALH